MCVCLCAGLNNQETTWTKKIHAEIATSVNWLVGRRPIEIIGMFLFGWTCEKRETVDIPASSRHDKTNMGL